MKLTFARFRYHVSRCFLGFMVAAILLLPHASAQIVEIPDPNLERAIRETLELPTDVPITQQEMLRLTGFAAEVAQVEDLTGLEYAHNLKRLHLRNNPIQDLTPIGNLTKLELLHLVGVPIQDLTPIGNLTELRELHLSHCGITDITPLGHLTKVVWLNLAANRIVNISPLANLTGLKTLWLHENRIVDVSSLANLTQLEELNLDHNQIVDISPLANLTGLETLWIYGNLIGDFSSLQGLSLTDLRHDEVCEFPVSPIRDRIANRSLPSIVQGWDNGIQNLPHLSYYDRIAYHDLFWFHLPFGLRFRLTPQGYQATGDIDGAIAQREKLLAKNPNMLFLCTVRIARAGLNRHYPEDWFGWLRDEGGNLVPGSRFISDSYLIDFRLPEVQDIIVQQAISVSKCGLYDGILFDAWGEHSRLLTGYGSHRNHSTVEEEWQARLTILQRIRANVPDDFLIICNHNWKKLPLSAPYINGGFMETHHEGEYTNSKLADIEDALIWYEENVREPQVNILRGEGLGTEPPDSPNNRRWMRLFTTMSLTCSDGYALYTLGDIGGQKQYQRHIWHSFWDADLGQPVGPKTQRYQEDIEGLYIREFTNGWAVYNRSGQAQTVTLPSSATPVSDRGSNAASLTHLLPDLDGEIYLSTRSFADVNRDGTVNVLDLVMVANGFGKSAPDPNGDGVVNILDLVFVAQQFNQ